MPSSLRGPTREAVLDRSSHDAAQSSAQRGQGGPTAGLNIVRALEARLSRLIRRPATPGLEGTPSNGSGTALTDPASVSNPGFLPVQPELFRARELSALVNLADTFSSRQDVNQVVQELCQYLAETAQCTSARVYVPSQGGSELTLCASHSIRGSQDHQGTHGAFPTQIPDWIRRGPDWVRSGLNWRSPNVVRRESAPAELSRLRDALLFGDGSQSSLLLPLATPDAFLGLVVLSEMRSWSRAPFGPETVARCQLIAQHVALVIENIRLRLSEQELKRTKADFVSLVSHELRVPLTHISAIADLLAGGISDEQAKKDMLRTVDQECERLLYLAQLMPEVLNPDEEEAEIELEVVSVTRIVEQRVGVFKARHADHQFEIDAPAAPVLARGNAVLLSVVLDNLLSNAVKYSAPGSAIRAGVQETGSQVLVYVEDQGIGIPEDQLGKIFSRRYRVRNPATRRVPGSGLGLYIARQLIKRQGGTLWAENNNGRGSRLCFRINKIEVADE